MGQLKLPNINDRDLKLYIYFVFFFCCWEKSFERRKISFYFLRPQKLGCKLLVLTLVSNIKTKRKIAPTFRGLLKNPEFY